LSERVTPPLARYYGLKSEQGVLVYNLVQRGPAAKAGLTRGDIITAVDGQPVTDVYDVERAINRKKPGEAVTLKILRGNKGLDKQVPMTELPTTEDLPQGLI
jgi:S1-C subfamily serine protease